MREREFRAWDEDEKQYHYNCGLFPTPWNERTKGNYYTISSDGITVNQYHPDIEVEDFINQTDLNGVKIFEGDIVELTFWDHIRGREGHRENFKVEFQGSRYVYISIKTGLPSSCDALADRTKVRKIGNIHENPELLGADHA